jgi:hypothetical protein
MKYLLFFLCVILSSCNVVKTLTSGETSLDEDFFKGPGISYAPNALTNTYGEIKMAFDQVEKLKPANALLSNYSDKAPISFGDEWANFTNFFSLYDMSVPVTARQYMIDQIDFSGKDRYGDHMSYLSYPLERVDVLCVFGIGVALQQTLGAEDFPTNGTYEIEITKDFADVTTRDCGTDLSDMIGNILQLTVSTPATTATYDHKIDFPMLSQSIYIRRNATSLNLATVRQDSGENRFSRLVIGHDKVSNGFAMEYIDCPNGTFNNDDGQDLLGIKYYWDSITTTGTVIYNYLLYRDFATDERDGGSIAGPTGTSDPISVHLTNSGGDGNTSYLGCVNRNDFSMNTDGSSCTGGSAHPGFQIDAMTDMFNLKSNLSGAVPYTNYNNVSDTTNIGFTVPGNMGNDFGTN